MRQFAQSGRPGTRTNTTPAVWGKQRESTPPTALKGHRIHTVRRLATGWAHKAFVGSQGNFRIIKITGVG